MEIRSGTILWAQIKHPTGRGRDIPRYYLVISVAQKPQVSLFCLGISKQCPDPPPATAFLLPFDPNPKIRPATGLRRRCACFIDWAIEIHREEVLNPCVGNISKQLLVRIKQALDSRGNK